MCFFLLFFLFDAYFSLISTYFCFIFLFDQCFPFISTFLLVRDVLNLGFSFRFISLLNGLFAFPCILFDRFFFFSHLPFFWLMFCFESLEQLDKYKKGNKNPIFFSFFYHLLISTLFSIIFVFMDIFFCKIYLFLFSEFFSDFLFFVDKTCWIEVFFSDLLLDGFVLLRYTFFLMFSSEIFEDLHPTKKKVTTSDFCCSSTIFLDFFFYYFSFLWIFLSEIYLFLLYFFVG